MKRTTILLAILLAAFGSYFGTEMAQKALAARNSSGTYSLPSGNPVVSGTTISSTWANATLSDLGSEVTNSLDRSGRGGMTGALKLSNGTSSAPSLAWTSETNSGLYRAGSNDLRLQVASSNIEKWTATGSTITGSETVSAGVVATQSTTNGTAVTATGNGTGNGVGATGGATSGAGLYGTGGTPNGKGVNGIGTGTAQGVYGTGGASAGPGVYGVGGTDGGVGGYFEGGLANGIGLKGNGTGTGVGGLFTGGGSGAAGVTSTGAGTSSGVFGTGGTTSGAGVHGVGGVTNGIGVWGEGTGTGTGGTFAGSTSGVGVSATGGATGAGISATGGGTQAGGTFASGTASTGASPQSAILATNGNLSLSGSANPNSNVGFSNVLTPSNIPKAWGYVSTDGVGGSTLIAGFNITNCGTVTAVGVLCTFATALANTNFAVSATSTANGVDPAFQVVEWTPSRSTTTFRMAAYTAAGLAHDLSTNAAHFSFIVMGTQ